MGNGDVVYSMQCCMKMPSMQSKGLWTSLHNRFALLPCFSSIQVPRRSLAFMAEDLFLQGMNHYICCPTQRNYDRKNNGLLGPMRTRTGNYWMGKVDQILWTSCYNRFTPSASVHVLHPIFFCKAQAMIAERKILLCKLLSSGESETIEIKPCSTIVYILGVSGKRFRQLTEK